MTLNLLSLSTKRIFYFILSALMLPVYDLLIAAILGREAVFRLSDPFSVILSLIASLCFFIFLEKALENRMYFSAIVSCSIAVLLPVVYMQIPVEFGDRPFIYITPTVLGILTVLLESIYSKKYQRIEVENWKTERAVQIGILHSILAIEMYIINRSVNFAQLVSELARNGTLLTYLFVVIRPLIMMPINFLIAAAPIYFYQKKKLKIPLVVFLTWFSTGAILFLLKWDNYPVTILSGGIRILPPQPDYLLRPWLPMILILISWKLEENYRERDLDLAAQSVDSELYLEAAEPEEDEDSEGSSDTPSSEEEEAEEEESEEEE